SLSLDYICYFLFNEQASTVIYTLSLHDALPISRHVLEGVAGRRRLHGGFLGGRPGRIARPCPVRRAAFTGGVRRAASCGEIAARDRKSTRLNSSHVKISYAVFCLKKKRNF